jgi:hypothetical protein
MNSNTLLIPVVIQIGLTVAIYFRLVLAKAAAVKAGQVNEARRALYDDAWPESVLHLNNNIRNQFELPVLFYVLVFALIQINAVGTIALLAAWVFALSRLAHAYVHTGVNIVKIRRNIFLVGAVSVLVMLLNLAVALAVNLFWA